MSTSIRTIFCTYNTGKVAHRVTVTRDADGFVKNQASACGVERGLNGPATAFHYVPNWAGKVCWRCQR